MRMSAITPAGPEPTEELGGRTVTEHEDADDQDRGSPDHRDQRRHRVGAAGSCQRPALRCSPNAASWSRRRPATSGGSPGIVASVVAAAVCS